MARSDSRLRITSSTNIESLVFDHLKEAGDNVSAKGARAITTHCLAEIAFRLDPKLEDPKLRFAVIESMHELEARANIIKSLFPELAPATLPAQPVWLPPTALNNVPVQPKPESKPRLEVVPEAAKPEKSQARQDNAGSGEASPSDGEIDTSDTPWARFNISSQKS